MTKFSAVRFDDQAGSHDHRTGIPPEKCLEIARAVAALAGDPKNELLLDLGAGTGLPGAWFPQVGFRYTGLDASEPMLKLFAERCPAKPGSVELRVADIDQRWPVGDHSVKVVFSSRAAHLFERAHLVDETVRVAKPGGLFVLGRVQRDEHSMRRRLRDQMRSALEQRGFQPADAGHRHRGILEAFREHGATILASIVAASWQAQHSAAEVLSSWKLTAGLGGCELEPAMKQEILDELWAWAESSFDSVLTGFSSEERFTLEVARMRSS